MSSGPPFRDVHYPLNVFMDILTHEEGEVRYLHYGLFDRPEQSIGEAQERSTQLLLRHLPPPPARLLDVGTGVGTTLRKLTSLGYDAFGITPDESQIAFLRRLHEDRIRVECVRYEDYDGGPFDVVLFQESSQYIDSDALFSHTRAPKLIVLDEFATKPVDLPGALHSLPRFLEAAARYGYELVQEMDLSERAAPTIDYFNLRLPRYRDLLVSELGITNDQVDELIASGHRYRKLYSDGVYGYRLLRFRSNGG